MDLGGAGWGIMTIIGPLLLGIVLLVVFLRNRKTRRSDVDRSERATHDLYRAEDAAHRGEDDKVP